MAAKKKPAKKSAKKSARKTGGAARMKKMLEGMLKAFRSGKTSAGKRVKAQGYKIMAARLLSAGLITAAEAAKHGGKKASKKNAKKPAKKAAKRGAKKAAKRGAKKGAKKGAKRGARKASKPLQARKGGIAKFERKIVGAVTRGPLPTSIKITETYERPRKKTTRRVPARRR
jgi:hypothetical protein